MIYLKKNFKIRKQSNKAYKTVFDIQSRIDSYAKKLDVENTIGLHIRRTLKEQDKDYDTWFDQSIKSEIEKNKDARFFLATDNKWTEEKFMMKYGDIMVKTKIDFDEVEGGEIYAGGHRHRHSPTEKD